MKDERGIKANSSQYKMANVKNIDFAGMNIVPAIFKRTLVLNSM